MASIYTNCLVTCLTLIFVTGFCSAAGKARDNGFGSEIEWWRLKDGLKAAKEQNKILMLIIHKSWCGACKAFKPKFSASEAIQTLSKKFIMVNVEDGDEPRDRKYSPDGKYIPRILFLKPNGDIMMDVVNTKGNPGYKYYYADAPTVLASMKLALTLTANTNNETIKEDF